MGDAPRLASDEIDVTLWLRPREGGELSAERATELGRTPPGQRDYLTREELELRHGPDPADVEAVCELLEQSYAIRKVWRRWRALRVRGYPQAFLQLIGGIFNAKAAQPGDPRSPARVPDGAAGGTSLLLRNVAAVFGLAQTSEFARRRVPRPSRTRADGAPAIGPQAIARHYSFPPGLDGSGQTIGIIAFGGTFDRAGFERSMEASGVPPCEVTSESVDLGALDPSDDAPALVTRAAGAFAPGARIKLYFAENTKRGWIDGLVTTLADRHDAPSIVALSCGQPESVFAPAEIVCFEEVFIAAALVGVTVIVSSGGPGPTDGAGGGFAVAYPAASRFVLACGGTELSADDGRITGERVRNVAGRLGGGFSTRSALPAWQRRPLGAALERYRNRSAVEPGRGIPDLVATADPGFSAGAVAPFIAALVARINQRLDGAPAGFFTPLLYERGEELGVFREIRACAVPPFQPAHGWDPSVGLGAPRGSELMQLLTG
jgi:kumamolisin